MQPDPLLRTIVAGALTLDRNLEGRAPILVTLFVGGAVISGQIVTAREFMLAGGFTDSITEILDRGDQVQGAPALDKERLDDGAIHLKNVCFLSGGRTIAAADPRSASYWRGRIEAVEGFILGSITAPDRRSEWLLTAE